MLGMETIAEAIEVALKSVVVKFLKWILRGTIKSSYIICLVAGLMSIILYINGQKKAGKYISLSVIIYAILQAIGGEFLD